MTDTVTLVRGMDIRSFTIAGGSLVTVDERLNGRTVCLFNTFSDEDVHDRVGAWIRLLLGEGWTADREDSVFTP